MKRPTAYLLAAVLLVAGAGVIVYRTWRGGSALQPGAAGELPAAGTGPARFLLNEILFQPVSGQPQWVELVNAGGESETLDGIVLENQAGEKFALPDRLTLQAGGVLLVRFDGQTGTEASTIHAAPTTYLAPEGFIQLSGSQGQLDRIAWGDGQPQNASLSRGGFEDSLTPGTSLGRVPRLITSDPLEWVSYSPQQATPGQPNPQPGVEILLPMDGAIVTAPAESLSWYTVAGAARYRVQIAADSSFGSPVVDQTVEAPPITTIALEPGHYVWRVQAIAGGGQTAEYSPPSVLTVRAKQGPVAGRPRSMLDWVMPAIHAQTPSSTIDDELPTVLDVPLIQQHKDTRMLLLETRRETAGTFGHAWDMDHGDLATWDRADSMNCAPATVAMLSQYYGGRLSQDRINYEIFNTLEPGPQGDLGWAPRGYNRDRLSRAMAFAFGVPPRIDPPIDDELFRAALWKVRIEHGMPGIACKNRHCVAVVGFGGSPALLVLNDPGLTGTYLAPLSFLRDATVFVMARPPSPAADPSQASADPMLVRPRSDEPDVSRDSDGDGVVDFDEIYRFKTNPRLKDHDEDELPDKEDIRASVHDSRHGFAYGGRGRDFDGDGRMMELDDDADDGGCIDGWEDGNKNGKFEQGPGETDNFAKDDDPCITGTYEWVYDLVENNAQFQVQNYSRHAAEISLLPQADGTLKGTARLSFVMTNLQRELTTRCIANDVRGELMTWKVQLVGEARRQEDGSLKITMKPTSGAQPTYRYPWRRECDQLDTGVNTNQVPPWPWNEATLKDGVFDVKSSPPLGPGEFGAPGRGSGMHMHLEQKRPPAPR